MFLYLSFIVCIYTMYIYIENACMHVYAQFNLLLCVCKNMIFISLFYKILLEKNVTYTRVYSLSLTQN